MLDREVLTVPEAAARLRISKNKVYDMVARKQLPHFRVGNCIRFLGDVLDEWMRRQQTGDTDD